MKKHLTQTAFLVLLLPFLFVCPTAESDPSSQWPTIRLLDVSSTEPIPGGTNLMPLCVGEMRYVMVQRGEKEKADIHIMELDPQNQAAPYRLHGSLPRVEHLGVDAETNVVMAEVEELNYGDQTRFEPPELRMPARLEPGVILTNKCNITVVKIQHPDHVVTRGNLVETLFYTGQAQVETPAGTFRCVCVRDSSITHLGAANITTTSDRYLAPGIGLIVEQYHEHVHALWIMHWNYDLTVFLAELPKPDPR